MQLVNLAEYRSSDVVKTLRELLDLAEDGQIYGLVFVCKLGPNDHRAGRAGAYKRAPEQALPATYMLKDYLSRHTLGSAVNSTY